MDVYTNVDQDVQKRLWDVYNTDEYVNYPDDEIQAASTIIDVSMVKLLLNSVLVTKLVTYLSVLTKLLKLTVTGVLP